MALYHAALLTLLFVIDLSSSAFPFANLRVLPRTCDDVNISFLLLLPLNNVVKSFMKGYFYKSTSSQYYYEAML